MAIQHLLIDGSWRPALDPVGTFTATCPATREPLAEVFPISSARDVELALASARRAASELRCVSPDALAAFLEAYATRIEAEREPLVQLAARETGLPAAPRLRDVELPRTTDQLRQAAAACRDRSFCRATIDTRNNLRSFHAPIGPVVILGPSNFPFAFNAAAGGDFAAALAAGNPVIAKAHPGHPGTTRALAALAHAVIEEQRLPRGTLQLLYHLAPEEGLRLVAHPLVGATAFTGSRAAGLRLKRAADEAGRPIYLELSSANPVVLLPGALEERAEAIAEELVSSCTLGAGQFCTRPGLVLLVAAPASEAFLRAARERFARTPAGLLLGESTLARLRDGVAALVRLGAEVLTGNREEHGPGYRFENTLLRVAGERFLASPRELQLETFGGVCLAVVARDDDELLALVAALDGNLTGTIYSDRQGRDDALHDRVEPLLRARVGRLINDRMPTGVAVSPAMNHGGPYPATGHPGFTSVGIPASLLRFTALQAYDGVRPHRLPEALRDRNPTGHMLRLVDGEWTTRSLGH